MRTWRAYLYDILDPQDSEDIAQKIEESEFATELVHRTRDCMRRLRLGVPPAEGKGLGSDPNTVAEYLDNTLSADRVGEFEKICLESDVYLAEVASCHQILTLVLGEPAEIDPASRTRMYQIAAQVDAPPVQTDSVAPAEQVDVSAARGTVTPPAPPRRPKPEVPEYLRESRTGYWPVAAAVLIGALITFALLIMLGPAEWGNRLVGIAPVEEPAAESTDQPADAATDAAQPDPASASEPTTEPEPDVEPPAETPTEPEPAATDVPADTELARPEPATIVDPDAPPAPKPDGDPAEMPDDARPADPTDSAPPADAPAPLPDADPLPPEPMPDAPDPLTDEPAPEGATDDVPQSTAFGRYTSKRGEVLLRFDAESGGWKRLPPMAPLATGDRLLSLPLYRPTIALSTSVSIQPDGAAAMELVGWTPDGVPIINVEYGRLLMMTVGKAGNSIQLNFGTQEAVLTFVDAEATVALESQRVLTPGANPIEQPADQAVDLYATSGSIRVELDGQPPLDVQAPTRRALIGKGIAPPGEVPSWVNSEAVSDSNLRAAGNVEGLLQPDQLVGLVLKELSTDRRSEVRSLAIRSAAYLDDFEPCIDALNEKYEKNFWPIYIETLRAAIARSPDTAQRVRNTFDRQGLVGEELFRMLWGYSANDLQNGDAAKLVEGLNHDSLDYRVLAIWNLRDITGLPNHRYYPQDLARQRAQPVNRWKELLRQGKIVPRAEAAGP